MKPTVGEVAMGAPVSTISGDGCTSVYNQLYNCLDLMYLLNYTALALSMSYILYQSSNETQITLSVSISVGFYVAVLMTTVLYHFIVAILKACKMYDIAREKINGLLERKYEGMVPVELDEISAIQIEAVRMVKNPSPRLTDQFPVRKK